MVTVRPVRPRIHGEAAGRENPVPRPLIPRTWVFPFQRIGKRHAGAFFLPVGFVAMANNLQMPVCLLVKTGRKQGYTIFSALPRTNCDGVLFKIEIPHPQLQTLMQPQSCRIDDSGHQVVRFGQLVYQAPNFAGGRAQPEAAAACVL